MCPKRSKIDFIAKRLNTFVHTYLFSLKTFALIVSAHPTAHANSQATSNIIGQMAITIAFPGFNDLGRTVTPVFLLMDHFLYQFSAFSEKMKKIYRLEV